MTNIEQMIQNLCPNGVEFKKLGEVCTCTKGEQLNKSGLLDEGYPVINGGINPSGYWSEYNYPANKITISQGGASAGYVNFQQTPFWAGAHCYVLIDTIPEIDYKFLYYLVKQNEPSFMQCQYGAGIPALGAKTVNSLEIPLPPLEIQKKIVECLDKFSALAAELQAELQMRRKQYEYYRTHLLTPHSGCNSAGDSTDDCNWDSKPLKELIVSLKTGLNPRTNFKLNTPESNIPYITGKDIYDNVINVTSATDMIDEKARDLINKRACLEGNILLFASTGTGTVGRMAYVPEYNNDWAMSETLYAIKTKDVLLPRFLMHCLYSPVCRSQFENKISRGSVPHLKVVDLLNVNIPLPPIEEQKRLTELLDKFDKLTTSLSDGIPAEQIRQQKRYEYYRDLLLTFPRKAV